MRTKHLKCNNCGYRGRIETISRKEARVRGIPVGRPRCPKCGSYDMIIDDE